MNADQAAHSPSHLAWVKSSHSGSDGGDCVEVAATRTRMHVRDSKRPEFEALGFTLAGWSALADSLGSVDGTGIPPHELA